MEIGWAAYAGAQFGWADAAGAQFGLADAAGVEFGYPAAVWAAGPADVAFADVELK